MEAIRPIVGPDAMKAKVSLNDGNPQYSYSEDQLRCYGGIEVLLRQKVYGRDIENGTKFISVERMNDGENNVKYWANVDENLHKFESKQEFDDFENQRVLEDDSGLSY